MIRRSVFDRVRVEFSKVNMKSHPRFPTVTMKKARLQKKTSEKKRQEDSEVLDCVKFHLNRSRRISGCTHAQSERLRGDDARHQRTNGCNFVRGIAKIPRISLLRHPSRPRIPLALYLSLFYSFFCFLFCVADLRVCQRACIDDDECIARVVYPAYVHTCARRDALTWDWPCLDNAITSLNFLSLCLTSVTGGPPR